MYAAFVFDRKPCVVRFRPFTQFVLRHADRSSARNVESTVTVLEEAFL